MIEVKCSLCGADDYTILESHRNDKYQRQDAEIRTVICKECGMCYVNPRPSDDEIVGIYATDYVGTREKIFGSGELLRRDRFMELIARWIDERIGISNSPGKVLDIGCSEGSLLVALQKRAWEVWGVEPTPHFAEVARQRCGEHIKTSRLEQAGLPHGYFDMITIAQTLEHMPDPMSTLQIIRKLLKDDGVLYIDVPNALKPKHANIFTATHLNMFTPNTLELFLRKTAFKPAIIHDSWDIRIIAHAGDIDLNVNPRVEGDDWQETMAEAKRAYVPMVFRRIKLRSASLVTRTIRRILGQSRGDRIVDYLSMFSHWE